MKKGFTMIELVFVIVILGILAGIAIPRLAATRDDASATKAAMEIKDVITQVAAYYTIKGQWATAAVTGGEDKDKIINTHDQDIAAAATTPSKGLENLSATLNNVAGRAGDKWTACISITPTNTGGSILIGDKNATDSYCKTVAKVPAVEEWIKMGGKQGIIVGGSGIYK
ncbi:type II secretion system protein [Campylobacter fetus]|uniref:type II secretion system protein n=1 Tax=Campylobacter fetus TaxID=196 RepID=UPI000818A4C1|nr:prepilin-type N-terminal cleavage/methylation domain-containing protein [Campylobacter fetus]